MQKVIIKCISNYSLVSRCHIIIFDKFKNKIFDEYTKCSKTKLYLSKGTYKAIIIPFNVYSCMLSVNFVVTDKDNYFNFCFKKIEDSLKITVALVDKFYDNLPIERGKIKLWQGHTQ